MLHLVLYLGPHGEIIFNRIAGSNFLGHIKGCLSS